MAALQGLFSSARKGEKSAKGIFSLVDSARGGKRRLIGCWLVKRGAKLGLRHAVDATKMDAAYFSFPDQNFAIESSIIF